MKKFSKFLSILLVVGMILPGIVQANGEEMEKRLSGKTRVETAIEASKEVYPSGAEAVVLAGFNGEVDALTGTLLASAKDAPLLLTLQGKLSPETKTEIRRLKPKTVYILGGETVVSAAVEAELKDYTVIRVKGNNRAETAVAVANEVKGQTKHVFLAKGYNNQLADALAIGPVSAKEDIPVFLTDTDKIPQATISAMKDLGVTHVTILGGEVAVSKKVEAELKDYIVDRVNGNNRVETALAIARKYLPNAENLILAYGWKSADGLVGGYVGAKKNAPILLTDRDKLDAKTEAYIKENIGKVFVLGGTSVVSDLVFKKVETAIAFRDPSKDPIVISKITFNKAASEIKEIKSNGQKVADISYTPYKATVTLLEPEYLEVSSIGIFKILEDLGVKTVTFDGTNWFDVKPENVSDILDAANIVEGKDAFSITYTAKIQQAGEVQFTQAFTVEFVLVK